MFPGCYFCLCYYRLFYVSECDFSLFLRLIFKVKNINIFLNIFLLHCKKKTIIIKFIIIIIFIVTAHRCCLGDTRLQEKLRKKPPKKKE